MNLLFMKYFILNLIFFSFLAQSQAQNKCVDIFLANQFQGQVTLGNSTFGPSLFYKADPSLKGKLPQTLRFGTYNLLNLFENVINQQAQRWGNARAIEKIDPDFMVGVEIENIHAFQIFSKHYLKGLYEPLLIDGNDSRGIDVGILVKKDLPIEMEWRSFKTFSMNSEQPIFSRDLPVGLVYERDANGIRNKYPKFAIIATHYKSKKSKPGQPDTGILRGKQVDATLQVIKKIQQEFSQDLPIILSGDFNNSVHRGPEFQALFNKGFKDTLDLTPKPGTHEERATHYYFSHLGDREANQIDAILILGNQKMKVHESKVIPDTDINGRTLSAPQSFSERQLRPSDHRPIFAEIQLK